MWTNLPLGGNWAIPIPEKKANRGGRGGGVEDIEDIAIYFFESFHSPLEICKIVQHPFLEIPSPGQKPSSKIYGNSTWVFLDHPWKFHFFFSWPQEFRHSLSWMSYFRKNPNRGDGWGYTSLKTLLEFPFFYFIPGKSRQNKAQSQYSTKLC